MTKIYKLKRRNPEVKSLHITRFLVFAFVLCFTFGCSSNEDDTEEEPVIEEPVVIENPISNLWNFDTLDGWEDGSQNMDGLVNYSITDGILRIHTRANTSDRPKVRTLDKIYNYGKYTWKVYVPEMGVGDNASIVSFLYNDDSHELDFEIGYGTTALRTTLGAASDDLVVYMTTQKNPAQSIQKTIKRNNWYTLAIEIKNINKRYYATWTINGSTVAESYLEFGGETLFKIFCSVENLGFMGDHLPTQESYGLFDSVQYEQQL